MRERAISALLGTVTHGGNSVALARTVLMAQRLLSVDEVLALLGVTRNTWAKWRARGCGPEAIRLPNGALRIREDDLNDWLDALEVA